MGDFIELDKVRKEDEYKRRDKMIETGEYMSVHVVLNNLSEEELEEGYIPFIETKIKNVSYETVFGVINAMMSLASDLCEKFPPVAKMVSDIRSEVVKQSEVAFEDEEE